MANVWFVSDTHFGHKNICKYRLFNSPEEHDELIFDNVMRTVRKRDTLWMLGDTAFTHESLKYIRAISDRVLRLNLVMGNHCVMGSMHIRDYLACGDNINVHGLVSHKNFWISHAPIHPQELRGRRGNLHGHLHSTVVKDEYGRIDERYRCVSMEHIQYTPINILDLKEEFRIIEETRRCN